MKKYALTIIVLLAFSILFNFANSKEKFDYTCYKRGVEIIFPYEKAIFKIKEIYNNSPDRKKKRTS